MWPMSTTRPELVEDPIYVIGPMTSQQNRKSKCTWLQWKYFSDHCERVQLIDIDAGLPVRSLQRLVKRPGFRVLGRVLSRFQGRPFVDQLLREQGFELSGTNGRAILFFLYCCSRTHAGLSPGAESLRSSLVNICHTMDTHPEVTYATGPRMISGHPSGVTLDFLCHEYRSPEIEQMTRTFGIDRSLHLPVHCDHEIYKDWGCAKEIDLLFYGSCGPAYPFRSRLRAILEGLRRSDRSLRVMIVDPEKPVMLEDLSRLINRAWLTISTQSRYGWFLRKYVEIPMSRSVVAGDLPEYDKPFFESDYVALTREMSDEVLERRLRDALSDKPRLLEMASRMYERVCGPDGYTLENGLERFRRAIDHVSRLARSSPAAR
jgi:hypothetical protein